MSPELASSSEDRKKEEAIKQAQEEEDWKLAKVDEAIPYYNDL